MLSALLLKRDFAASWVDRASNVIQRRSYSDEAEEHLSRVSLENMVPATGAVEAGAHHREFIAYLAPPIWTQVFIRLRSECQGAICFLGDMLKGRLDMDSFLHSSSGLILRTIYL